MTRSGTNCWFNVTAQSDGEANFTVYVNDTAGHWGSNTSYYLLRDSAYVSSSLLGAICL